MKARDYLPVPTPAWPVEEMEAARWSIRKARLRVYYLLAVLGMPIHLDPPEARTFAVGMVEGRFEVGPSGIDDEEARNP